MNIKLLETLNKQMIALAVLVAMIMVAGAVLWILSPTEGNKYGELGVNLIFGAGLTFGLMGVERMMATRAKVRDQAAEELAARQEKAAVEREQKAADEARLIQSLLQRDDLSNVLLLRGRNLSSTIMTGKTFDGADLSGAVLDRAELGRASMIETKLEEANATDANFTDAVLRNVKGQRFTAVRSAFDRMDCMEANWSHAKFHDCHMEQAEFIRGVLNSTDFSASYLLQAKFNKAEGTDSIFAHADLRAASFEGARLVRPNFSGAILQDVDFTNAILEEPDFSGADLRDCRGTERAFKNPITDSNTLMPSAIGARSL